ncbi:hypothetical protein [Corynebacterium xerosis]|uniref:Uncharacterized protein n=1 Tax=Corynebacterium xerosis TaxID=1725 RepID=A0ABV3UV27_9CORY
MANRNRTIRMFGIKIEGDNPPSYYLDVIETAAEKAIAEPVKLRSDYTIVIASEGFQINRASKNIFLQILGGDPNDAALVYDQKEKETEEIDFGDGKWPVTEARCSFSIIGNNRIIALENRVGGITGTMLQEFLRIGLPETDRSKALTVFPISSPSFEKSVKQYTRIREFSITLSSSNPGFDDMDHQLANAGLDMNAERLTLTANASQGESLDVNGPFIDGAIELSKDPTAPVENLRVVGKKRGERVERAESLKLHQERITVRDGTTDGRDVRKDNFLEAVLPFVRSMVISRRKYGDNDLS